EPRARADPRLSHLACRAPRRSQRLPGGCRRYRPGPFLLPRKTRKTRLSREPREPFLLAPKTPETPLSHRRRPRPRRRCLTDERLRSERRHVVQALEPEHRERVGDPALDPATEHARAVRHPPGLSATPGA